MYSAHYFRGDMMRAYPEVYLHDIVESQGKLFDFVSQNYPEKDTSDFINTYMTSKTRESIDQGKAYVSTMNASELWDYFQQTEHYHLKNGKALKGFIPDWIGEFYAYYQWFYNVSSKEIIKKAKEEAEQLVQEANARIENTIRTIKEAQAEKEKTRQARQELTEFRQSMEALASKEQEEKIARKMQKLQEKQNRKKEKKTRDTDNGLSAQEQAAQKAKQEAERLASIVPGAMVKIKGQNSVGEVLEVNGKNAVVAFGSIKTTIKVERLERTNIVPQKVDSSTKSTFVSNQTQDSMYEKKLNFKQDIDVRGMRGDEALQAVTYFIDDAILVGMSRVRILHGTGTGILRTLIRQYLQTVPGIRHFADEHVQFGGAGITVVDL